MAGNSKVSSSEKGKALKIFKVGRNPKTLVEVSIYGTSKGRFMAAFYDAAGKRIRPERPTLADAEQAARDYITKHISPEALERDLLDSKAAKIVAPADLMTACHEFSDAQKLLAPFKANLLDAVRFFVAKKGENLKSVTAAVAVEDFLSKFKGRQKTEKANKVYLGRIKKDWGDAILSEVDHVFVNKWIAGIQGSERTKRNYFDGVSLLFRHAKENGWYPLEKQPPTEHANRPEAENPQIEIFSPEEGVALLTAAKDLKSPGFAVIALVGWSGCRTEEVAPEFADKGRVRWEDLLWADRYKDAEGVEEADKPNEDQIHVTPDAAKKTRKKDLRRYIPLLPNLAEMLRPLRGTRGAIYPATLQGINKEFARIAKKAGIEWKRNALRHSYGTYRAAITKNVPAVAFEMGNTPEMVGRHYNRPTPPHIARQWFRASV
jgi:integrase